MKNVIWSEISQNDLNDIADYISQDNPDAADNVIDRIEAAVDMLARSTIGRQGRMAGTHEKVVTGLPYIIAYNVAEQNLVVVRIIHGARNWQPGEWPKE